jgi:hypothetical protein
VVDGVVKGGLARSECFYLLPAEVRMSDERMSDEHPKPPFVPRAIRRLSVPIILAWLALTVLVTVGVPSLEQVEQAHSV